MIRFTAKDFPPALGPDRCHCNRRKHPSRVACRKCLRKKKRELVKKMPKVNNRICTCPCGNRCEVGKMFCKPCLEAAEKGEDRCLYRAVSKFIKGVRR